MNLDLFPVEYGQAKTEQHTKRQLKPIWHDMSVAIAAGLILLAFSCTDALTAIMVLSLMVIVVFLADGFWEA